MLQGEADDASRDGRDDDQPRHLLGGGLDLAADERAGPGADYVEPVPPEVGQQSQGAPDVEHDHEAEPVRFRLGLRNDQRVPPEKRGVNDRMAKARNREKLGNSLQNARGLSLESY